MSQLDITDDRILSVEGIAEHTGYSEVQITQLIIETGLEAVEYDEQPYYSWRAFHKKMRQYCTSQVLNKLSYEYQQLTAPKTIARLQDLLTERESELSKVKEEFKNLTYKYQSTLKIFMEYTKDVRDKDVDFADEKAQKGLLELRKL